MEHSEHAEGRGIYGIMAEFHEPEEVLVAAESAYAQGFRKMDAYSPVPVEGLAEAIGFHKNRVPMVVLICGVLGAFGGFGLQVFSAVINYPVNIGGRPYFSWPMFIPITFETTVLLAAIGATFGMILLNGLPRLYHPVFNAPGFVEANQRYFFLCIQADDPLFNPEETSKFLEGLNPHAITLVEN
jgi:Protein of unknown function (DUF3341)